MVRQMKKLSGFTFVSLCVTLILFQFGVEPVNASPISCSTQIDLGTSSSYSALGASVANTGAATLIHGNLGVSPGAQTGSKAIQDKGLGQELLDALTDKEIVNELFVWRS
jgi:hypothetical protein